MNEIPTTFPELVGDIIHQFQGLHIIDIREATKFDLLFIFSETKTSMLAVSMNPHNPLATPIEAPPNWMELPKALPEQIRRHIIKLKIDQVTTYGDDNIIVLSTHRKGDNFQIRQYRLYIELIKNNPNIVLQEDKIIYAYRTYDLTAKRPLFPGLTYSPPIQAATPTIHDWNNSIRLYRQDYERLILNAASGPLIAMIKRTIKRLEKKLAALEGDLSKWNDHIKDKDEADLLLMYEHKDVHLDSVRIEGTSIELDARFTVLSNANIKYKRYRKARQAQVPINRQIEIAESERSRLQTLLDRPITSLFDIEDIKLALNVQIDDYNRKLTKKSSDNDKLSPYKVSVGDHVFLFGRNANQNDNLTFKVAPKDSWFFHIKDRPGAHVIYLGTELDEISINAAVTIALYLSRLTSGEVVYAMVKTLKKGQHQGQVVMKSYRTYRLITLDRTTIEAVKLAKRYQR